MKLKFATGLAYFTRNSFLHNLIKFYNLLFYLKMPRETSF